VYHESPSDGRQLVPVVERHTVAVGHDDLLVPISYNRPQIDPTGLLLQLVAGVGRSTSTPT
jgi:hypothetical protein